LPVDSLQEGVVDIAVLFGHKILEDAGAVL